MMLMTYLMAIRALAVVSRNCCKMIVENTAGRSFLLELTAVF